MKYFKLLTLFLISFFFIACDQNPDKKVVIPSPFEEKPKTPLEELVNKVENTVIMEPLRSLEDNIYFYNMKQTLARSLENSTQKEIFYSCNDFKKTLKTTIQTEYSSDFVAGSWQRKEIEKLAQDLTKEQCADIYNLRAVLLADLQEAINISETQEDFIQNAKPAIESYATKVLGKSDYYIDLLDKALVPYKKIRQVFYPLEQAGYGTFILEQNTFSAAKKIITPLLQGKSKEINEEKVNQLINKAQEEEKLLFVFLKQYESLEQANGECIKTFYTGLKDKWYDFMYEMEKLPKAKRQEYADKRYKQAKDGLQKKCPELLQKSKKTKNQANQIQQQDSYNYTEETSAEEEEETYDF